VLHGHGVNMRYLPEVLSRCKEAACKQFIAQELVVRAAKRCMRSMWLRLARSEQHAVALGEDVIEQLAKGRRAEWVKIAAHAGESLPGVVDLEKLPPTWAWEQRLRAAVGMHMEFRVSTSVHEHAVFYEIPVAAETEECCGQMWVREVTGSRLQGSARCAR
jgi:hypothetical protein